MRVLFWGTPEFAAAPLRALIGEGFDVAGVVTQPDKPQGRSRKMLAPPVKQIALEEKIPCFQPATPRDSDFGEMVSVMQPDISVVVAYGHILPKRIIDLPRLGTLNIHASLGALTLVEALTLISLDEATEAAQDESLVSYAPKVMREDARVDWALDAAEVSRTIRAYDPKPGAFTTRDGLDVKVYGPRVIEGAGGIANVTPGQVMSASEDVIVACGRGAIRISDVQPAGRSRMSAAEWARGRGISPGDILGR